MTMHSPGRAARSPVAQAAHPDNFAATAAPPPARQFGLPTASALVVGSVIGTGVFALPSALAGYGPISLVAFGLVTVGALALALTFRALTGRLPLSGGPYVYARDAFGEFAGFLNAWSYWITAWAGNAAIVVAWVGYVEVFWNSGHAKGWSIVIALIGLWVPAFVNLAGLRSIAWFQVLTTIVKFIPLLFIATVGLLFIRSANFGAFNASGGSSLGAISAAAAIALFSYLGIETAIRSATWAGLRCWARSPARSFTSWAPSWCSARSRTVNSWHRARPSPTPPTRSSVAAGAATWSPSPQSSRESAPLSVGR
jgi:amino acid transporter